MMERSLSAVDDFEEEDGEEEEEEDDQPLHLWAREVGKFLELESLTRLRQTDGRLHRRLATLADDRALCCGPTKRRRTAWWASQCKVCEVRAAHDADYFEKCAGLLDGAPGGAARLSKTGIEGEIRRDIARTFAYRDFFRHDESQGAEFSPTQDALADVLLALANAHPKTRYCQGMNFVAAAMLECHECGGDLAVCEERPHDARIGPEREPPKQRPAPSRRSVEGTFWVMSALSLSSDRSNALELSELWRPGMPQLKLRVFVLDRLVMRHLPRLRAHFRSIGLAPDVLASQWFITVFAYSLPTHWLPRLWDAIILEGWAAVYRIALARLALSQESLLELSLDDVGRYLRERKDVESTAEGGTAESLLAYSRRRFATLDATTIAELVEQFGFALVEERLACDSPPPPDSKLPTSEWLVRYGGEGRDVLDDESLGSLRARLEDLDDLGNSDAECVRNRIERAERKAVEARERVRKCAESVNTCRTRVGTCLDAKRLALKSATSLTESSLARGEDHEATSYEDGEDQLDEPRGRFLVRCISFLKQQAPPAAEAAKGAVSSAYATLVPSLVMTARGLSSLQTAATQREVSLRSARQKLERAAENMAHASTDLEEAHDAKRAAQQQLHTIIGDSYRRRQLTITDVVEESASADLRLVTRLKNSERARSG